MKPLGLSASRVRVNTAVAFAASIVALVASGCSWVSIDPAAEGVRVRGAAAVAGCEKVGTTKARTKARLGIFARGEKKVAEELATIARNDAPALGGDTIVAEGPVTADGTQRFSVYDCSGDGQ